MKISINIVTFNAMKYLDDCLKSILNQTFRDFKISVIDNASSDGTAEHLRTYYPDIAILQNFKNLGISKANNQGIKLTDSEYVLAVNQDVILQPDYLEKMVAFADAHPEGGVFGGKILKLSNDENFRQQHGPETIDTAGIFASKSRRFYDRGAGEEDKGQYDQTEEVFGISANLALYRRQALEEVKLKNIRSRDGFIFTTDFDYYEYFDEDFFMYKDDVDMSWRLRLAGWLAYYFPAAEAYHYRTGFGQAKFTNRTTIKDRRRKSQFVNRLSYKNHWLMLAKNESWDNFLRHFPWIFFYELKKIAYVLVLEVGTVKSIGQFFLLLPNALNKRKQIRKMKKVTPEEMRKWFK